MPTRRELLLGALWAATAAAGFWAGSKRGTGLCLPCPEEDPCCDAPPEIPITTESYLALTNIGFNHQRALMREKARWPVIHAAGMLTVPEYFRDTIIPTANLHYPNDDLLPMDGATGRWAEDPNWFVDGKRAFNGSFFPLNDPGPFMTLSPRGDRSCFWAPRVRFMPQTKPRFKDGFFGETISTLHEVHWAEPGRECKRIYATPLHLRWTKDMTGVIVKKGRTTRADFEREDMGDVLVINRDVWEAFKRAQ